MNSKHDNSIDSNYELCSTTSSALYAYICATQIELHENVELSKTCLYRKNVFKYDEETTFIKLYIFSLYIIIQRFFILDLIFSTQSDYCLFYFYRRDWEFVLMKFKIYLNRKIFCLNSNQFSWHFVNEKSCSVDCKCVSSNIASHYV